MDKKLTHIDNQGNACMVDVSGKSMQIRTATAVGFISLQNETIELIKQNHIKKGDVLTIAEIAGIQAAKQTAGLIPLCHHIQLTKIEVKAKIVENGVEIESLARCVGQTGVEMEALTAVNIALLTVYDMCKAVDKQMEIGHIRLIEKTKLDL